MLPSQNLFNLAYDSKIPLTCTFEITNRCNLQCRHCYRENGTSLLEMTTEKIKDILFQLDRAGTLYLVFTGGEIFLRDDIVELCKEARKLHFDLRLFTNATLIASETAEALAPLGISGVEISLYGRKHTHDHITKVPGSFDKTLRTVKTLTSFGITVILKCPLMRDNIEDYHWLKQLSDELKVTLKADPTITPKNNGDKSILSHRLDDSKLKSIFGDAIFPSLVKDCVITPSPLAGRSLDREAEEGGGDLNPLPSFVKDAGFSDEHSNLLCSAGHNLAAIGYDGHVYPCLQLPISLGNLKKDSFSSIWKGRILSDYRQIRPSHIIECSSCDLTPYCQRCPGLALIEDGDILGPSRIACKLAKINAHRN